MIRFVVSSSEQAREATVSGRAAALPHAQPPPEMDPAGESPPGTLPGEESPEVGGSEPGGLGRVFGVRWHQEGSGWLCPGDGGQRWVPRL